MEEICSICQLEYDLAGHRPIILDCKHRMGFLCLQGMYDLNGGVIKCPECSDTCLNDLKDYKVDEALFRILKRFIVYCFGDHGDLKERSTSIYPRTLQTFCDGCTNQNKDRSSFSKDIPRILKQGLHRFYKQYKKSLSYEMKYYILQSFSGDLQDQINLAQIIIHYTTTDPNCVVHPNQSCSKLNTVDFALYCENCSKEGISISLQNVYPVFCEQLGADFMSNYYLPGSILKNFLKFSPFYFSPIMEVFLAKTQPLQPVNSLHNKSCMGCGKGYKLGSRMPYKLTCGHFLCWTCINIGLYCPIHRGTVSDAMPYFDESLYKYPQCRSCLTTNFGFDSLPYHYFCDCIICESCRKTVPFCTRCLEGVCDSNETRLKLHKRSLNIVRYLKVEIACCNCRMNLATMFSYNRWIPICNNCQDTNESNQPIESSCAFDKGLFDAIGLHFMQTLGDSKFPIDPISKKLEKIIKITGKQPELYMNIQALLEIKELKRFSTVYPLTREDKRHYLGSQSSPYALEFNVDKPVKFCGLIVSGCIDADQQIWLRISNKQHVLIEYAHLLKGKINYLILKQYFEVNYYKVEIMFYETGRFFCGKALAQNMNKVVGDGITFEFLDSTNRNGHLKGPIMGILYSI